MSEEITKSSSKVPWIIGIVVLLLALPFGYLVMYSANAKQGIEFSPDDFTVRRFSYVKVDWLNWTMRGLEHEDITSVMHQSLIGDGWIQTDPHTEQNWHLVSDNLTAKDSPDLDAKILDDYLNMEFLSDWTDDAKNKKKAQVLWPAVAVLARHYVYWAIPDLMDLVIDQKTLSNRKFTLAVNWIVNKALLQNAKQLIEDESFEAAQKSLIAAKKFGTSKEIDALLVQVASLMPADKNKPSESEDPETK